MSFNLENYEDVNARIKRFRTAHISGRIETEIVNIDVQHGFVLVKASVYREFEDERASAIDFAFEARSDRGVNRDFWVENAVTSAIGRAIGLLMPSDQRPTRQDMEKVERLAPSVPEKTVWDTHIVEGAVVQLPPTLASAIGEIEATLGGVQVEEVPSCTHGRRVWKQGVSTKTKKPYGGWLCISHLHKDQCEPLWYVERDGQWVKP